MQGVSFSLRLVPGKRSSVGTRSIDPYQLQIQLQLKTVHSSVM